MDLGGATGHLAAAVRERYPRMRTAVFDLPDVVEFARIEYHFEAVEWIAGDFFSDPLPHADIFGLGRILHDWDEERIAALLTKIRDALPSGGLFRASIIATYKHIQIIPDVTQTPGAESGSVYQPT